MRPKTLGKRLCISTDGSAPAYVDLLAKGQSSRKCNCANVTGSTVVAYHDEWSEFETTDVCRHYSDNARKMCKDQR